MQSSSCPLMNFTAISKALHAIVWCSRIVLLKDPARLTTTKTRLYIDGEYILRRDDEELQEVNGATTAAI